jgi:EAL domain-containing protein (putative c-di-GMP-specific phosphodiesterase class I)
MLTEACRQLQAWRDAGIDVPRLAVGVSARQVRQRGFVEKVRRIMTAHAIAPYCFELEFDEALLIDADDRVARMLHELRAIGITFCLDDFGAGQASLTCLNRFPVENVKIDRSLTPEVGAETGAGTMVAAIIAMAHALGKRVVADGVATEKQAALLARLGCHQIEGPYVSDPLAAEGFADFLKQSAANAGRRPAFITKSPARA